MAMIVLTVLGFLAVFLYAGVNISSSLVDLRQMRDDQKLVSIATVVGALTHELQKERGASAGFIASEGAEFRSILTDQRKLSDEKIKAFQRV
ncbi:MAG: nitrate- and nitrite sensing domain-containing protein, partial [Silicimonas sp.]|nr:nitrate- and nitrite sensing domain-containing protein [Silicimonas sp.]